MHYIYIAECSDKTFYTGYTTNIEKRLKAHNEGKGAKYTKGRRPITLRYQEVYEIKGEALKREYAIKQMSRTQKEELMNTHQRMKDIKE